VRAPARGFDDACPSCGRAPFLPLSLIFPVFFVPFVLVAPMLTPCRRRPRTSRTVLEPRIQQPLDPKDAQMRPSLLPEFLYFSWRAA
jgi:hypothetical protein